MKRFLFAVGVTRNTDSRCPDSSESKKSEIPLIDLGQHQWYCQPQ